MGKNEWSCSHKTDRLTPTNTLKVEMLERIYLYFKVVALGKENTTMPVEAHQDVEMNNFTDFSTFGYSASRLVNSRK